MQHLADPRLYDFLLAQARRPRRGAEDVDVRVIAARAALRSAAGNDLAPLEALWNAEPDGDVRDALEMMGMPGGLALHRRCLRDTACWAAHLHDEASTDAQTAAAALAILGQTDAAALPALEAALDVRDEEVFVEILYAIDRVAVNGSPSIVTALDRMRTDLLGTRFYSHMQPLVIAVLARLAHR
jgi:hypothetical protein